MMLEVGLLPCVGDRLGGLGEVWVACYRLGFLFNHIKVPPCGLVVLEMRFNNIPCRRRDWYMLLKRIGCF